MDGRRQKKWGSEWTRRAHRIPNPLFLVDNLKLETYIGKFIDSTINQLNQKLLKLKINYLTKELLYNNKNNKIQY